MDWNNSLTDVVQLESGCSLAAPRLLSANARNFDVLEGRTTKRLIKTGQQYACSKGRPFLLRLKAGRPGRPQERIIFPPKPVTRKSNASGPAVTVCKTSTNSGPKLRENLPNSPDLADALAAAQQKILELSEIDSKREREIRGIKTERAEQEERIKRIESAVEGLRREWRKMNGLPPHNPGLPTFLQPGA